jgi:hypothetical protein|tara:strand:+ start:1234 stop:1764 length:531 start_codon:yes stop_codon:yes gene_type:complete
MGYLDKSKQTVTAHFTKRGRELLADALSGNETGDYIITKWALGDDEIDYNLYDESLSSNLRGKVIENMPMMETPVNEHEVMNTFIVDAPEIALQAQLTNIPDQIVLTGKDDIIDINPMTDNYEGTETYEFVLSHDNVAHMYDINNPPVADFFFDVSNQGSPPVGTPPIANFNYQVT